MSSTDEPFERKDLPLPSKVRRHSLVHRFQYFLYRRRIGRKMKQFVKVSKATNKNKKAEQLVALDRHDIQYRDDPKPPTVPPFCSC